MADFTFVGSATAYGTTANTSITHGLTIASGDLVVLWGYFNGVTGLAPQVDADVGGEWNDLSSASAWATETGKTMAAWKIATGSEPSSYTTTNTAGGARLVVMVFTPVAGTVVLTNSNQTYFTTPGWYLEANAIDGQVIQDNALSIVFCGKDDRLTDESYTDATPTTYIGEVGGTEGQAGAGCYRIYSTGETFSGNVEIKTADSNDGMNSTCVSHHYAFNVVPSFDYPYVSSRRLSSGYTDGATLYMPREIDAGDTLLMIVGVRAYTIDTTTVTGWKLIGNSDASLTDQVIWCRKATASEASTVSMSWTSAGDASWSGAIYAIKNADDPEANPPAVAIAYLDSDNINPDSPSLNPTGGAKNYLWLSTFFTRNESYLTAYPTNYVNVLVASNYTSDGTSAFAEREYYAASENPTAWTQDTANDWSAATIAIHPAPYQLPYESRKHRLLPIKKPWTSANQPPPYTPIDPNNKFGCFWAVIPGWGSFDEATTTTSTKLRSVGDYPELKFQVENGSLGDGGTLKTVTVNTYPWGTARVLRNDNNTEADADNTCIGVYEKFTSGQSIGPQFPDRKNLSVVSFGTTASNFTTQAGDPRMFTRSDNGNNVDHDFMLSTGNGASREPRFRIRVDSGNTQQIIDSSVDIGNNDAVAMMGWLRPGATGVHLGVASLIASNGWAYSQAESSDQSGVGYSPDADHYVSIGCNGDSAGVDISDPWYGDIYGCFCFDHKLSEEEFRQFVFNPWQIFKPKTIYAPIDEPKEELIPVVIPWTKKPPEGTEIDWVNPINRYNRVIYPFNDMSGNTRGFKGYHRDRIVRTTPLDGTTGGAAGMVENAIGAMGREVHMKDNYDFSGNEKWRLANPQSTDWGATTYNFGFTHIFKRPAGGTICWLSDKLALKIISEKLIVRHQGFSAGDEYDFNIPCATNEWHIVTAIVTDIDGTSANGTLNLWLDGVHQVVDDTSHSWSNAGQALPTYLGYESEFGGGNESHHALFIYHDDPVVSASNNNWNIPSSDVLKLHNNPWQIFKPKMLPMPAEKKEHKLIQAPRVWTKQPPAGTPIDWSNALTRGLTQSIVWTDDYGSADGSDIRNYADANNPASRQAIDGFIRSEARNIGQFIAADFLQNDTDALIELGASTKVPCTNEEGTVSMWVRREFADAFFDWPTPGHCFKDGASIKHQWFWHNSNDDWSFNHGDTPTEVAAALILQSTWTHVLTSWSDSADTLRLIIDGNLVYDKSWTINAGTLDNWSIVDPSNAEGDCYYGPITVWDRQLSVGESNSFYERPWQIFKPQTTHALEEAEKPDLITFERPWGGS